MVFILSEVGVLTLKKINTSDLMSNLLLLLLAVTGWIRSLEWIDKTVDELEKISPLYTKISLYFDIQTMGWFMLIGSFILIAAMFLDGKAYAIFIVLGNSLSGFIHILFGLLSVSGAEMFTTYYINLSVGIIQIILVAIGVLILCKKQ